MVGTAEQVTPCLQQFPGYYTGIQYRLKSAKGHQVTWYHVRIYSSIKVSRFSIKHRRIKGQAAISMRQ